MAHSTPRAAPLTHSPTPPYHPHPSPQSPELSIEVSLDDVRAAAQAMGFRLLREETVDAPYMGGGGRAGGGHTWHVAWEHERVLRLRQTWDPWRRHTRVRAGGRGSHEAWAWGTAAEWRRR